MNRLDVLRLQKGRRLLVAGALVEAEGEESFSVPEAVSTLKRMKIPPPQNPHQMLSRLSEQELVMPLGRGRWTITPKGQSELAGELGFEVDLEITGQQPSTSTQLLQPGPVPPPFAPPAIQEGVDALLSDSPFEKNVFVMMPFRNDASHKTIEAALRDELSRHGMLARLAKDGNVMDGLWENVCCYMWASKYGIAVFEHITEELHNPNVSIEVGYMLGIGRRCLLLKEEDVPKLPTDILGRVYRAFTKAEIERTVRETVTAWVVSDIKYKGG